MGALPHAQVWIRLCKTPVRGVLPKDPILTHNYGGIKNFWGFCAWLQELVQIVGQRIDLALYMAYLCIHGHHS